MMLAMNAVELRAALDEIRRAGKSVGLVPTMGFLHEGHLSLVRIAREHCDVVVLTLFVNPTQFGPGEDLDRYPRDLERDRALCAAAGVYLLYAPAATGTYAPDHSVYVVEDKMSGVLCGASRPGHFRGVLTIVAKLFNLVQPDVAVFGEKDAQQIRLIRRMARDLDFPVNIVGGPIVREADGLAMSSRNRNLDEASRASAPRLHAALQAVSGAFASGVREVDALRKTARDTLGDLAPGELDYLAFADNESLEPLEGVVKRPALVALAVRFPGARLIDNTVLTP